MTYAQKILTKQMTKIYQHGGIALPKSWLRAAGMLRHKRKALERHRNKVRREWEREAI